MSKKVLFCFLLIAMYNIYMEQFFIENGDFILKLTVAVLLGMFIGAERLFVHKEAGMKTHALVSMGAAIFIIISETMAEKYINLSGFNPIMMASNIIVGIGFLGAGIIMFRDSHLLGLTTAGGLWVTSGIGMAAGFGLFNLAIISTILVLFIFIVMNIFEKPIRKISEENFLIKEEAK
ncbi:MAG: MgtC family protein [Candidatus Nomurabacteria bacterium GW2011_GWE1_32_28]|uniref:MgtC family protein n=1 Tax=Candidatus Nomurabacteria bacterium GW2011_GWF1_31_48 TaxID=1618767 RepID=A0A0G0BI03_9BACT|nr:MAG: MgtC family protein [Candidatus Nomurabacteria bacterium GW2011_GWF2_30_133]KKP28919.1 MAG: MgtC family protein [Candidatus Nomurabacteria bacterium GW2011_GWE2_31_40]KKP30657.1 MAG: MgtC family protein [Candidatus Nomurabacteria bacterium GW2011_GWF1_31_48]KKP35175.1 MAG: MgtC family protein [Candidatus Nomurabacteria bacterium GW2011_GWE1_32_28]HAS80484.1 methyltransferase [Candidatus Nomurabacteria bacterium]